MGDPLEVPGKADQFYERLREEIFSGRRRPGDAIREKQGTAVSQATVRHALLRLEHEGLVVRRRHRDTTVVNLTKEDVANLIDVRIQLEVLACQKARVKLADPGVRARAEDLVRRIAKSPKADEAFHEFVWELSDNPLLVRTLKALSTPMFAFVVLLRRRGLQRDEDRVASHRVFLDALVAHDPSSLQPTIENHVRGAYAPFFRASIKDMQELSRGADLDDAVAQMASIGGESKHREFLRWIPGGAVVTDSSRRTLFANQAFERLCGKRFEDLAGTRMHDPFWITIHQRVVADRSTLLVLGRQRGSQRITICFPMDVAGETMLGELGFDVSGLLAWIDAPNAPPVDLKTIAPAANIASRVPVQPELLDAFFQALPGIATWKDLQGRLLWANPEYSRLTGKAWYAGHSPVENWPLALGTQIMAHDKMVRDTRMPFATTDSFPFARGETRRIAIRFPLFNSYLQLEGTASLGFDHNLLKRSANMLKRLAEGNYRTVRLESAPVPTSPLSP